MSSAPLTVLALDFGGTKLAAGVVDTSTGELVAVSRMATPTDGGAEAVFEAMVALARSLGMPNAIEGVGVSFGGHVHKGRVLRSLHVSGWEDYPLANRLRDVFCVDEVRVANDANAAALGEWRFGAGRGTESMLYLTVSTGIGGGLILNRALYPGWRGMAGEIGHMKMVIDGPHCTCGMRGCLEAVASGPAIARRACELLQDPEFASSSLQGQGQHALTAADVAAAAENGDLLGLKTLQEAAAYLGVAIANAVNFLDVECVVVGGGVSRAGDHWWRTVERSARSEMLNVTPDVGLTRAVLNGNENILGAAALLESP
jgi:glucokinase